jgi:cysteine desulfurase / selenocysteine lyase
MTSKEILHLEKNILEWDAHKVRNDFPILATEMNGVPLVYLDNASTSQKPQVVIDRMIQFYVDENSNVHRGIYTLAEQATEAYENVRQTVRQFLHAASVKEVIFTKSATEGINLVAQSYGRKFLNKGDEIILSTLEHHSNIVPWQLLAEEKGLKIKVIPVTINGDLDMEAYKKLFTKKTRFVAITHTSNVFGTITPIKEIIKIAHAQGARILVDACQSVVHTPINVREMDCDFLVFSSHKLYGPTGTGILYGKKELLEEMPPYQGGGDMIKHVGFEETLFQEPPLCFEAGTPNIAGVIGLGTAIEYLSQFSADSIISYEQELHEYATQGLKEIPGVTIVATPKYSAPIISFVMEGIHPHDIATVLSHSGICVRAGHHCAMPLVETFGLPATLRVSMSFYNTVSELDLLFNALHTVKKVFKI